jgi:hypothetical protein
MLVKSTQASRSESFCVEFFLLSNSIVSIRLRLILINPFSNLSNLLVRSVFLMFFFRNEVLFPSKHNFYKFWEYFRILEVKFLAFYRSVSQIRERKRKKLSTYKKNNILVENASILQRKKIFI